MKRKSISNAWPTFDAPLLQAIADAFVRRRKALRHRISLSCEREYTESPEGTWERLNLNFGVNFLRLSVWADGAMWVGVGVRAKGRNAGWAFQETFHGDMRDVSGETLVRMVEATLALRLGSDPAKFREELRAVWARVRPRPD